MNIITIMQIHLVVNFMDSANSFVLCRNYLTARFLDLPLF